MSTLTLYERIVDNEISPVQCSSETEFYELWRDRNLTQLAPVEQALTGGALANSLSWVFTTGYQATLRNAFGDSPLEGWAAFAATEDKQDPELHPGTTLVESDGLHRLEGYKSWVAHSRVVDTLIVTVNDPAGDKYKACGVVLARDSDGVILSHRNEPSFLGTVSQGFAHFDNTPVKSEQIIEFEPIRQFGRTEAKFVMLAGVAFMLSHTRPDDQLSQRLVCVGSALESLLNEEHTSRKAYAAVDLEFQHCVDLFERQLDESQVANYSKDKRLFTMYSERIQRRAKRQ